MTTPAPKQTEATLWAELYVWLHRRAEMLRQEKAAVILTAQNEETGQEKIDTGTLSDSETSPDLTKNQKGGIDHVAE